jgi:hypothetical protein
MNEPTQSSRNVFLKSLSREEQLGMLYDMAQSNRGNIKSESANNKREHISMRDDIHFIKGEVEGIGRRHNNTDPSLSTSQKINQALSSRSASWIWYRDKVLAPTLAAVHTLIIMAILYLAFGGKLP